MPLHDLAIVSLGGRQVYLAAGRFMAVLALCGIMWFSMRRDRDAARLKVSTMTVESYQAGYKAAVKKVSADAKQSDWYLVIVASVMAMFVLLYEAASIGLGWVVGVIAEWPWGKGEARETGPG